MAEPTIEFKGPPIKTTIFRDWSPYSAEKIIPQLPKNLKYTPPRPNEELRKKIAPREGQLDQGDKTILGLSLAFLERGFLEDDFGNNHEERGKFLLGQTIKIDGKDVSLFELSRKVNKLSSNAITHALSSALLVDEQAITKRSEDLMGKINSIEKERGYYLPSDLVPIDDLARSVIAHILG